MRLTWAEHVQRVKEKRQVCEKYRSERNGRRPLGGPGIRWRRVVEGDLPLVGRNMMEAEKVTLDR